MSILTFTLHRKTLKVSALEGRFTEKLSFEARFPKGDSLSTQEGKQVKTGYVEIVFEKTEYETEKIYFIDASEDIDTGTVYPPSISFFAKVTPDIFALIRDSNTNTTLSLKLHTDMLGPIQFNDPMGEAKLWDTSLQNPVAVESYEITLSHSE